MPSATERKLATRSSVETGSKTLMGEPVISIIKPPVSVPGNPTEYISTPPSRSFCAAVAISS